MSCKTMCGCTNLIGLLHKLTKKEVYIGCQIEDFYFNTSTDQAVTSGSYTIPKDGWYVSYISSHGADISKVMIYYPVGTNTICNYYTKGQVINYQIGSNSRIQAKDGTWLEAGNVGVTSGQEVNQASVVFQYIGQISEPVLILTDKGFREGVGRFGNFLSGTSFENTPRVIEPQLTDVKYDATGNVTFSFFAVTEFTVPESKNYLVASSGDDYANVYIDGKPAVWLAKNNVDRSLLTQNKGANSAYNTNLVNEVYLTAGTHTLVLWNCSTICCNISSIVAVKDPQTNQVYAYDTTYKYVRSEANCLSDIPAKKFIFKADNEYNQETLVDKTVTWKVDSISSAYFDPNSETGRGSGNLIFYSRLIVEYVIRKYENDVPTNETSTITRKYNGSWTYPMDNPRSSIPSSALQIGSVVEV